MNSFKFKDANNSIDKKRRLFKQLNRIEVDETPSGSVFGALRGGTTAG